MRVYPGVLEDSSCGRSTIRGAVVRVSARNRRPILLKRPVQRLYPLEVKSSDPQELSCAGEEVGNGSAPHKRLLIQKTLLSLLLPRQSRRTAARLADERRRACIEDSWPRCWSTQGRMLGTEHWTNWVVLLLDECNAVYLSKYSLSELYFNTDRLLFNGLWYSLAAQQVFVAIANPDSLSFG